MSAPFVIDVARESDMDFVRDSLRRSYRDSPRTARWPNEAFALWIADYMDQTLPRCRIHVARPVDWDQGIIGWVAAEQQEDRFVVRYTFVRTMFRKQGVMTALINSMEPKGELIFSSLRPPFSEALKRSGFRFEREPSQPTRKK